MVRIMRSADIQNYNGVFYNISLVICHIVLSVCVS